MKFKHITAAKYLIPLLIINIINCTMPTESAISDDTTNYTVTFNTNGGTAIQSQTIGEGSHAIRPNNPTKSGYKFINWYSDDSYTKIWRFEENPVISDITLYALWEASLSKTQTGSINTVGFSEHFIYEDDSLFTMKYCPGGFFPTGTDNNGGYITLPIPFWVGETEVTYKLWKIIYSWAEQNGYSFSSPGSQGDGVGDTDLHPVSSINWRDVIVFCNALTEWYNSKNETEISLSCVYKINGTPIRSSQESNGSVCDSVIPDYNADGFRLLESNEWECSARYKDGNSWTNGSYASGAVAYYNNTTATSAVAWYILNAANSSHPVKEKLPNSLGIYDMSGNNYEWCFDYYNSTSKRILRGGSWASHPADSFGHILMQLGFVNCDDPFDESNSVGFRLARNMN